MTGSIKTGLLKVTDDASSSASGELVIGQSSGVPVYHYNNSVDGTLATLNLAQSFSALQTFNAGATVDSGQTLTLTGATVAGAPTWSSTQSLDTSGNAGTATALETARTLWGVSFDGTANVTAAPTFGAGATVSSGQTLTLNGATISGTIAGTPTWSGAHTHSAKSKWVSAPTQFYPLGTSERKQILHNVAAVHSNSGSQIGSYLLTLPHAITTSGENTFVRMVIKGFDYNQQRTIELVITGYAKSDAGMWTNFAVHNRGEAIRISEVRLGEDSSGKPVIILGTDSTVISYPSLTVTEFEANWQGATAFDYSSGWSFTGPHLDADYTAAGVDIEQTIDVKTRLPVEVDAYRNINFLGGDAAAQSIGVASNVLRIGGGTSGGSLDDDSQNQLLTWDVGDITANVPVTVGDGSTFSALTINSASGADGILYYTDGTGNIVWSVGKDNSAGDAYTISASSALGTNNIIQATSSAITASVPVILADTSVPASAAASGTAGQVAWDSSYFYVCVATDTWKRTALSTW